MQFSQACEAIGLWLSWETNPGCDNLFFIKILVCLWVTTKVFSLLMRPVTTKVFTTSATAITVQLTSRLTERFQEQLHLQYFGSTIKTNFLHSHVSVSSGSKQNLSELWEKLTIQNCKYQCSQWFFFFCWGFRTGHQTVFRFLIFLKLQWVWNVHPVHWYLSCKSVLCHPLCHRCPCLAMIFCGQELCWAAGQAEPSAEKASQGKYSFRNVTSSLGSHRLEYVTVSAKYFETTECGASL